MKLSLNYKALLLILLVLVHSSKLSARFLLSKQGQEEVNLDEITSEGTEDGGLMNVSIDVFFSLLQQFGLKFSADYTGTWTTSTPSITVYICWCKISLRT
ncbi:hypothetical protein OIU79_014698 [Salix purpurea]|uniref:Uncharacterized protein n=1 Tax=Salix purpurea TaxID=77065 RepID=A0A9Q0PRJ6_SALPP|nr:hypothetical protein OIU79_014698 [Salix purpurea]